MTNAAAETSISNESSHHRTATVRKYPDLPAWEIQAIIDQVYADTSDLKHVRDLHAYRAAIIRKRLVRASRMMRKWLQAEREWDRDRRALTEYHEGVAATSDELLALTPEEGAIAVEFARWLEDRFAMLDREEQVLLEFYVSDRSMSDVGAELGISAKAAQARSRRLRRKLGTEWRGRCDA